MVIRKSTDKDKKAIVDLLKASLGESSSPKNLNYWFWKHELNPFGKSEVLICDGIDRIHGLRAMMPWCWQLGQHCFSAFRAVDTATHPDEKGKGIFKKLTLRMVSQLQAAGAEFIFNTPNKQSLPGYLKMGWEPMGNIHVRIVPAFLYSKTTLEFNGPKADITLTAALCQAWNQVNASRKKLFTPKSPDYLKWRYLDNPVINYTILADQDLFIAAYFKDHRYFRELRIAELITVLPPKQIQSRLEGFLSTLLKHNKAAIITLSVDMGSYLSKIGLTLSVGPLLTTRNLVSPKMIPDLKKWAPSLGDLELL